MYSSIFEAFCRGLPTALQCSYPALSLGPDNPSPPWSTDSRCDKSPPHTVSVTIGRRGLPRSNTGYSGWYPHVCKQTVACLRRGLWQETNMASASHTPWNRARKGFDSLEIERSVSDPTEIM